MPARYDFTFVAASVAATGERNRIVRLGKKCRKENGRGTGEDNRPAILINCQFHGIPPIGILGERKEKVKGQSFKKAMCKENIKNTGEKDKNYCICKNGCGIIKPYYHVERRSFIW